MNAKRKNPAGELLPPKLAELVQAIGFPATLKLVERWGGIRLYVPLEEHITEQHPIAKELGIDVARKLAHAMHSEWIEVPRAARYLRKLRDQVIRGAGASAAQLARTYGMTRRNIFHIRGREEQDETQADLFGTE